MLNQEMLSNINSIKMDLGHQWFYQMSLFLPYSQNMVEVEGKRLREPLIKITWGPPSVQIGLKITSRSWFGLFGPAVSTRLQSVWFSWRGSHRELGVSDILPKQGLALGEKLHWALTPLPASPNFNHEWLSASIMFRGFLDTSIFTVRGFGGE